MQEIIPVNEIANIVIQVDAIHIRDVANGEMPYHYSSGNFGPGYVMIKGLVGRQKVFRFLVRQLAMRLKDHHDIDCLAGLVTGGVPPSIYLRDYLQMLWGYEIPWVYIRETRKVGGAGEHITGIVDVASGKPNPEIPLDSRFGVVEELTNYANSMTNGATTLRNAGYRCNHGYSILDYANTNAVTALNDNKVVLKCLITIPDILNELKNQQIYPDRIIEDYEWSQRDPTGWMAHYGFERKEHSR